MDNQKRITGFLEFLYNLRFENDLRVSRVTHLGLNSYLLLCLGVRRYIQKK